MKLVQGTLLYGEMVKERIVQKEPGACNYKKEKQRQSLHVIDALRLGDTSLADLPLTERLVLNQLKLFLEMIFLPFASSLNL